MSGLSAVHRICAIALVVLCSLAPSSVRALSCYGLSDKFFFRCDAQQCTSEFRAREVGAAGACARRLIVESVPAGVQSVVLQRLDRPLLVGIYEITLVHRYYGTPPVTATELANAFDEQQFRAPRLSVKELDDGTNLDQLRKEWVSQERWGLVRMIGWWTIELLVLGAALTIAFLTARTYRRRLIGVQPGPLLVPILVQGAVFLVALASIGSFALPALVGLVAPVVLTIWLSEAVAYVWWRVARKRANEF